MEKIDAKHSINDQCRTMGSVICQFLTIEGEQSSSLLAVGSKLEKIVFGAFLLEQYPMRAK